MYATIKVDLDQNQIQDLIDELLVSDVVNHLGVETILDTINTRSSWETELVDYMKKYHGMVGEDDHQEVLDGIEELKERIKELEEG